MAESALRIPQLCSPPALTTENRTPSGGSDCPRSSLPQQATLPSRARAQVCSAPALTSSNCASEGASTSVAGPDPQQTIAPSTLTAQVWASPLDRAVNAP